MVFKLEAKAWRPLFNLGVSSSTQYLDRWGWTYKWLATIEFTPMYWKLYMGHGPCCTTIVLGPIRLNLNRYGSTEEVELIA